MTPRTRSWLGLISGMVAGFALLASLFGGQETTVALSLLAITFSMAGMALCLRTRRGCQIDKR
jgi:hypothetical protein